MTFDLHSGWPIVAAVVVAAFLYAAYRSYRPGWIVFRYMAIFNIFALFIMSFFSTGYMTAFLLFGTASNVGAWLIMAAERPK